MEAKSFFSKSSNIFSVAILLAGLSTFGAGVYISETNAKDMQKQTLKNEHRIQLMEKTLSQEKQKYEMQIQLQQKQIQQDESQLHILEQQNSELKNEVITYKQRSESPSPVTQTDSSQRKVNVVATAYTASCGGCSGTTSTGIDVSNTTTYQGKTVIATDPSVIPTHSIVKIDTDDGQSFTAIVEDKGGAIKGNKIDVLVANENTAINFGRQRATITILREGA
jgi:3D (Asp-Asp-Asp) domain-containing protein